MFVIVPIISCPILRPAKAQRDKEMLGVRCNISYIPLDIVIATSITAPNDPISTEAKNISLGGALKTHCFIFNTSTIGELNNNLSDTNT